MSKVVYDSYNETDFVGNEGKFGGHVVTDIIVDPNQGGRLAGSFKDATYIRILEVDQGNVITFKAIEGNTLYTDHTLTAGNYSSFSIRSVSTELSSFSGTVVLILGGFDANTSNSRTVVLVTDYSARPEVHYAG